jgi:CubicO group peptidase (beta-lactamase class C family)
MLVLLVCFVFATCEQMWGCPLGPPISHVSPNLLQSSLAQVRGIVKATRLNSNNSCLSLGLVVDQQVLGAFAKGPSCSSKTAFRIGSVSKVFTALLVWQAHQDGFINLDAPVAERFPVVKQFRNRWLPDGGSITWRHLISHRAGLAREAPVHFCFVVVV